eukprot:7043649-Prymnesium_polylepis.2
MTRQCAQKRRLRRGASLTAWAAARQGHTQASGHRLSHRRPDRGGPQGVTFAAEAPFWCEGAFAVF